MYGAELGKNTTYDAIQWRLVGHDHVTCKTLPESIFAKGESRTTVDYAPISHQILPQLEPPELSSTRNEPPVNQYLYQDTRRLRRWGP